MDDIRLWGASSAATLHKFCPEVGGVHIALYKSHTRTARFAAGTVVSLIVIAVGGFDIKTKTGYSHRARSS